MLLSLFGSNSFFDLLGNSSFWFTLALIVGIIVVIVFAIKNPKIGGPVLASLGGIAMIVMTIYSIIQLNYYYSAKGGIHGALIGIFNTNEVEVVDELKFELKNIELVQDETGVYTASITIDKAISIDTKASLGVFVNGVPCDVTTEVDKDYVIAPYVYSFFDNDKSLICTDTLTLRFAFYEESTYLSVSTSANADVVKYWHNYFNKNGFVVEIAPFDKINTNISYGNGDLSNFGVVQYFVDGEHFLTKIYNCGEKLELPIIDETYYNWYVDSELISEDYIVQGNLFVQAFSEDFISTYKVTFNVGEESSSLLVTANNPYVSVVDPYREGWSFYGWSTDGTSDGVVNLETYEITSDIKLTAIFSRSVCTDVQPLNLTISRAESISTYYTLDFNSACELDSLLNSGYEFNMSVNYTYESTSGTASFDISMKEDYVHYYMESVVISGYLPLEITSNNTLIIGKRPVGVNYTFDIGTHIISISDIEIYSK